MFSILKLNFRSSIPRAPENEISEREAHFNPSSFFLLTAQA